MSCFGHSANCHAPLQYAQFTLALFIPVPFLQLYKLYIWDMSGYNLQKQSHYLEVVNSSVAMATCVLSCDLRMI